MKQLAARDDVLALVDILERELSPEVRRGSLPISIETWERALTGLARELLSRPGKQFRARLVELAFELGGGRTENLSPLLPQLVELIHAGSLIIDDIEDDSETRRGGPTLHRMFGVPLALNAGNWLYFAAFFLVERLGLGDAAALATYRRLSVTMFRCHQGQALDLTIDVTEVRQREVAALVEGAAALKTGALMRFAAELGAIAAAAAADRVELLGDFGERLGLGLQHLDDLGGLMSPSRAHKGVEDLSQGRLSWPWSYLASILDEVRFARLQSRLRQLRERGAIAEALPELRELLGRAAFDAVGEHLAGALDRPRTALDGDPAFERLAAEVSRLQKSYG